MNTEACQYNLGTLPPVVSITGYDNLPVNSQEAVMEHLAKVSSFTKPNNFIIQTKSF